MTREEIISNLLYMKRHVKEDTIVDMTIDEAIKALEQPCEMTAEEYRQRMIQAFHNVDCGELIALVVLPTEKEFEHLEWLLEKHYKAKPEPCTDAISRQAVLDLAKFDGRENLGSIIHAFDVEQLPPVNPAEKVGRWIPVSERLPKAGEYVGNVARYYLVQNEFGDMMVARYTHGEYWEQIYQLKPIGDEIVAWMSLPEPYTEGGEQE